MFGYLSGKMSQLLESFSGKKKISESEIERVSQTVHEALINAEVPFKIAQTLAVEIKVELKGVLQSSGVDLEERVQSILFRKLLSLMGGKDANQASLNFDVKKNSVILMTGLQGAGKTTTVAKLSMLLKREKGFSKCLFTSLDFVRPAAIEQLNILAQKTGDDFLMPVFGDIEASISNAIAKKNNYDCLFIDTPGRLHVNNELMQELATIYSASNPTYTFLVIDSMTGQESLNVSRAFNEAAPITGAVLSKADSDSKGGIALSFFAEIKKPVLFMGVGEKVDDLEKFVPQRIITRMMGGGDVETLSEKIEREISKEDRAASEDAQAKFFAGNFNLQDFLSQMEMMKNLGSIAKIASYLPGFNKISSEQMNQVEQKIKQLKAIIHSMTAQERLNPDIINASRRARISKGSGVSEKELGVLLNKFEESRQFAKLLGSGKLKNKF